MARWVGRIQKTTKARIQVEDWLRRYPPRAPFVRVVRLARLMELRGVTPEAVYGELRDLDASDLTGEVVREMRRRAADRERSRVPVFTHELLPDGQIRPLEEPVPRCG